MMDYENGDNALLEKLDFRERSMTTEVESGFLLYWGLDALTADMTYYGDRNGTKALNEMSYAECMRLMSAECVKEKVLPAWSLGRLLDMIPAVIEGKTGENYYAMLRITDNSFFLQSADLKKMVFVAKGIDLVSVTVKFVSSLIKRGKLEQKYLASGDVCKGQRNAYKTDYRQFNKDLKKNENEDE